MMTNTREDEMVLQWVDTQSTFYQSELDLRFQVLRDPLGMPKGSEILEYEDNVWHLVALLKQKVVGCVLFYPNEPKREEGRLLQMAVDSALRGQGLGQKLVMALEDRVKAEGFARVVLNARAVAFNFYEKLGYSFTSDVFDEVGIPHRSMKKEF